MSCNMSPVICLLSFVFHYLSPVIFLLISVSCHLTNCICHLSIVSWHICSFIYLLKLFFFSYVYCYLSSVICFLLSVFIICLLSRLYLYPSNECCLMKAVNCHIVLKSPQSDQYCLESITTFTYQYYNFILKPLTTKLWLFLLIYIIYSKFFQDVQLGKKFSQKQSL